MTGTVSDAEAEAAAAAESAGGAEPAGGRESPSAGLLDALLLVCVALLLYLPGLASLPPVHPQEAEVVAATRAMLAHGDALSMVGQAAVTGPGSVLVHWVHGAAAALSGEGADVSLETLRIPSLETLRIPSLAAAVAAVLLTYATGVALGGRIAGLSAALLAASTLALGASARLATADALVLALVLAAQWALARVWTAPAPARSTGRNAVFWASVGLGLVAGGPPVLLVVVPTMLVMLVLDRSRRRLSALDPLRGLPLAAVLAAVPVAGALFAAGAEGGSSLSPPATLSALFGTPGGVAAPPGSHVVLALLTFWPLSAFVPLIFAMPQRARLAPQTRRAIAFLAAWILPGWLVMEALPDKLPQHVLPFLPGLALLAGLAIAAHLPIAGRLTVRVGFAFVAAGAALIVFAVEAAAVVLEGRADPAGLAVGTAAVLSAFAASWFLMHGRMAAGIAAAVLASGLVAVLGFAILLPGLPSP